MAHNITGKIITSQNVNSGNTRVESQNINMAPEIFEVLETQKPGKGNEIQLTERRRKMTNIINRKINGHFPKTRNARKVPRLKFSFISLY